MPRHRFLVPVPAAVLLPPPPPFGPPPDPARFAAFAAPAHGQGPRAGGLGGGGVAPARLGAGRKGGKLVRVSVSARGIIKLHGYIATVTTRSRITLRR